jgi:carbon-monoxide dehydrogenase medium subunit
VRPDALVDITGIDRLAGIERSDAGVRIGATSTHSDVRGSTLLERLVPVLPATVATVTGGIQVHNVATVGGNVARAHPGYDYEGALLATDSDVLVEGPDGQRRLPAAEFFRGACRTALEATQLVTGVEVPAVDGDRCGGYAKKKEPASGNAIVGVATDVVVPPGSDVAESVRLAVNGLQATAVRLPAAEAVLEGTSLSPATIERAGEAAAESLDLAAVLDNTKASAEYRRTLLAPYVRKSVTAAAEGLA